MHSDNFQTDTRRINSGLLKLCVMICIAFSILAAFTYTASAASSGYCGGNARYELDDNGVLTISGTGNMYNYNYDPPFSYRAIKTVVIKDGVTSIGSHAFDGCSSLTMVMINKETHIANEVTA